MKIMLIVVISLVLLVTIAWVGLQVRPRPLPAFDGAAQPFALVELPLGLPAPVARFYETLYADAVPLHKSAVISGRGKMTLAGITVPARFRFTHNAGQAYRHYFEVTWFGLPIIRVNEHYLDGKARLDLPFGLTEGEPKVDQGANLALWAESLWLPSVFITDPRVHWEAMGEESAVLVVPWGESEERLVVRFDPSTNLLRFVESMRYREANSDGKSLWINEARDWQTVDGHQVPTVAAVTWYEDGRPWARFNVESIVYDADVSDYVRADGP